MDTLLSESGLNSPLIHNCIFLLVFKEYHEGFFAANVAVMDDVALHLLLSFILTLEQLSGSNFRRIMNLEQHNIQRKYISKYISHYFWSIFTQ